MKRTIKYVALDVHQATTAASVREASGRVIARTLLPTEEGAIMEFFRGMRGAIHVAFEEGTQAQWSHELLAPRVDRVSALTHPGSVACSNSGSMRSWSPTPGGCGSSTPMTPRTTGSMPKPSPDSDGSIPNSSPPSVTAAKSPRSISPASAPATAWCVLAPSSSTTCAAP